MAFYCAGCGVPVARSARFCSSCGRPVTELAQTGTAMPNPPGLLVRPLSGRKLGGVCRGLANRYGWEVLWVRVIAVLLAIGMFPVGLIAYIVLWVMVPQETPILLPATHLDTVV